MTVSFEMMFSCIPHVVCITDVNLICLFDLIVCQYKDNDVFVTHFQYFIKIFYFSV